MPADYAHHRFGKLVLKTMPPEAKQCVQRFRRMFDVGLHGPDIFFYYNPFFATAVGSLGDRFHAQTGREFFEAACKAADSEAAMAYLYGLLGHYCLDSHCHPFVNRLDSIGEARHVLLEKEFDRSLLVRDDKEHPERYSIAKKLRLTRGECLTVAGFYPGATGGNIRRSAKAMAFCSDFLAGGNPGKRKKLLDLLKPGISDHMIPAAQTEDLIVYTEELQTLYDKALADYPRMLEQLLAYKQTGEPLGEDFSGTFG